MYIPSNITIRRGSSALYICIFDYMLAKSSRIKEKKKRVLAWINYKLIPHDYQTSFNVYDFQ